MLNVLPTTSCKNKAGRGICMTSKLKYINQLRSDKFVGIIPAQFLHEDRCINSFVSIFTRHITVKPGFIYLLLQ